MRGYVEPDDVCSWNCGEGWVMCGRHVNALQLGSSFLEPKLASECSGWVLGQGDCYVLQVILY